MTEKFPIRINKYLADQGIATRKGADLLVEQGKVKINGRKAILGDRVQKGDKVEVDEKVKKQQNDFVYFAYNKPKGEETGKMPTGKIPVAGIFPVGRLDKDSSGLLIYTTDGRITDRLLNPKNIHDKEYEVETDRPVIGFMLKRMEMGINIEGYKTKRCQATKTGSNKFKIVLTEGKKHQIRRMCAAVGLQVKELKRTRVMNILLGNLKTGQTRPIVGLELGDFLDSLKLSRVD